MFWLQLAEDDCAQALIAKLVERRQEDRLLAADVLAHEWCRCEVASGEELYRCLGLPLDKLPSSAPGAHSSTDVKTGDPVLAYPTREAIDGAAAAGASKKRPRDDCEEGEL